MHTDVRGSTAEATSGNPVDSVPRQEQIKQIRATTPARVFFQVDSASVSSTCPKEKSAKLHRSLMSTAFVGAGLHDGRRHLKTDLTGGLRHNYQILSPTMKSRHLAIPSLLQGDGVLSHDDLVAGILLSYFVGTALVICSARQPPIDRISSCG
jgi:hypothetical protein